MIDIQNPYILHGKERKSVNSDYHETNITYLERYNFLNYFQILLFLLLPLSLLL